MAIQDDWTINYTAKTVTHTAGTTVYTANALYSWLQDTFDELGQMDDSVPMSAQTPTEYTLINGWDFGAEATDIQYLSGGAVTRESDNTVWANIYSVGSPLVAGTQIYIAQNGSVITSWWPSGHIDVLIKVKDAGVLIDSGNLTVMARRPGDRFAFFDVTATGGRQVAAISTESDINDDSDVSALFTAQTGTVSVTAATAAVTGVGTLFTTEYAVGDYLDIGGEIHRIATITDNTNLTLAANHSAGAAGAAHSKSTPKLEIGGPYTADVNQDSTDETYTYRVDCGGATLANVYKWLKAICERGSVTDIDGIEGQQYIRANAAYTAVPAAPFGTFAGGIFFGARGILITNMHGNDANSYQVIANDGVTYAPPVSINITVDKVVSGDRVAVFRLTAPGGSIDTSEYTTAASGNSTGSGTVTVTTAIGVDTPASGTLRLGTARTRYAYTSWTGSTFTLSGTLAEDQNSVNAFVPLVDAQASGTSISSAAMTYSADIPALVRVRKYGILPFEVESTIGSTGATVSAIRTTDGVVS